MDKLVLDALKNNSLRDFDRALSRIGASTATKISDARREGIRRRDAALARHELDANPIKQEFIRYATSVFLTELAKGPCCLAEALMANDVETPVGIDPRTIGLITQRLQRAGRICHVGYKKSPRATSHACPRSVWALTCEVRQ